MTIHPLFDNEAAYYNATHRIIITAADLAALTGGTGAQTLTPTGLPKGCMANCEFAYLKTPFTFSDATLTSCAVTLGDTGSNNRYVASYELTNAPVTASGGALATLYAYAAADATGLQAIFTPTANKNLNTCTAGEIHFYVNLLNAGPDAGAL